jgi:hypothetical protein
MTNLFHNFHFIIPIHILHVLKGKIVFDNFPIN